MAGVNDAQFQQLMAAARGPGGGGGAKKLALLESTSGQDWRTWKGTFGTVAVINGWNDVRQRRELRAAMAGEAARLTCDINVDPPALGLHEVAAPGRLGNIAAALAAYESRFFPAAAGRVARADYVNAHQLPSETVQQWHGRLRDIFLRAYPNDELEANQGLISAFATGLVDQTVAMHVLDIAPETYTAASDLAQMKAATAITLATAKRRGGHIHHMGLNALHDNNPGSPSCWYCAGAHKRTECAAYKKGKEYFGPERREFRDNRGSSGQTRGRGRINSGRPTNTRSGNHGNRGGGQRSGGQRNSGQNRARLNQMGGQNEDWSEDEESAAEGQDTPASGNARGR